MELHKKKPKKIPGPKTTYSTNTVLIGATTDCTTKTYFESDENSKGFSKIVKESDLFRENEKPSETG